MLFRSQLNRVPLNTPSLPPTAMALLMGSAHQACMRLSASVAAMAARPVSASLTVSQRFLVMVWFQASRYWPLQLIETGIFLVLALALAWLCFWRLSRRRA